MSGEYTKRHSQRLILKIEAKDIIDNKLNIKRELKEFSNNDNLIPLATNEAIRFFDRLENKIDVDKDINSIKRKIKRVKKLNTSRNNKSRTNKYYNELKDNMFVNAFIHVQFNNSKSSAKKEHRELKDKIITINGFNYKYYIGTSGGIKNKIVVFLREDYFEPFLKFANNGRFEDLEFEPSKLQAYLGLDFSGSIPLFNTRNILIVEDVISSFKADVIQVKDNDSKNGRPDVEHIKDYDYELNISDGCGLADVGFMTKVQNFLDVNYLPSGMIIRNAFMKGVLSNFDFKEFAKDNNIKYAYDIWGKKYKIQDIDIIMPKSMFKMWKGYNSIDDYLDKCEENGRTLSMVKLMDEEVSDTANLNYQFINPLRLSDEQISKLIKPTIDEFKDILGLDINKSILYLNGVNLKEDEFKFSDRHWINALFCDKRVIDDDFIKSSIYEVLKKKINSAKFGEIKVNGNYTTVIGDPVMLAQSAFGLEIKGLLGKNEFYSKYWIDKGVNKVGMFRPPMTSHYNIQNGDIVCNELMLKYYKYIKTMTIINGYDTTCSRMNGMDFDGDIKFTTEDETIVSNIQEHPAIECILEKASKKIAKISDFPDINENAMGNAIGSITNDGALLYHSLSKFEENSEEFNEIMYRIIITQLRQQSEIDSIKGVKKANIDQSMFNYYLNKPNYENDSEEVIKQKEFNRRILCPVKPLYFGYRYEDEIKKYKKSIKIAEKRSKVLFGKSIEDLKKSQNENEVNFYNLYEKYKPLDTFDSPMNKICKIFEDEFDNISFKSNRDFDYSIYKSKLQYETTEENDKIKIKIKQIYIDYKKKLELTKNKTNVEIDDNYLLDFIHSCHSICSNKYQLTDIMIDIFYNKSSSKRFLWMVCGETIVENLLSNNNYIVSYPVQNKNGELMFSGKRFNIISKEIEVDNL